ncbi:hypothetical protein BRC94_04065 [Halobacteriales archaeon QS_5_70_17]|nr:MAG: hypothetical protein BRC94_04065 [Halobacteriales archaeon QS_5_70_17]
METGVVALPTAVGPRILGGLLALAFAALACWGLVLAVVLWALGTDVGPARAAGLSLATKFVGAVAPFGQATGGPVSGLLVASGVDVEYERALAAVVAVDAVTCARGLALGAVGAGVGGPAGRRLPGAPAAIAVVAGGALARLHPRFESPGRAAVHERIGGPFAAVGRILRAVDASVAFPLLLGVLPPASVGTLVPSPGGAAGVEAALIGLLVSLAGVAVAPASAAVLPFRTATFWAPLPVRALPAACFGGRELFRAALP